MRLEGTACGAPRGNSFQLIGPVVHCADGYRGFKGPRAGVSEIQGILYNLE